MTHLIKAEGRLPCAGAPHHQQAPLISRNMLSVDSLTVSVVAFIPTLVHRAWLMLAYLVEIAYYLD